MYGKTRGTHGRVAEVAPGPGAGEEDPLQEERLIFFFLVQQRAE